MIHFPGQRKGEEVVQTIHKHGVVYVKIILAFVFVVLLPIGIFLGVWFRFFPLGDYYRYGVIAEIGSCIYFLFGLLFIYIRLTDEQFDVFILTTDRLIGITQVSFFHRNVSSAPLSQIQEATGSIQGLMPTLFHYGDLRVKTSSAEGSTFFIDHVEDPDGVAKQILDHVKAKRGSASSGTVAGDEPLGANAI